MFDGELVDDELAEEDELDEDALDDEDDDDDELLDGLACSTELEVISLFCVVLLQHRPSCHFRMLR